MLVICVSVWETGPHWASEIELLLEVFKWSRYASHTQLQTADKAKVGKFFFGT